MIPRSLRKLKAGQAGKNSLNRQEGVFFENFAQKTWRYRTTT